jgi:hypothetical protein
MNQVEGSTTVLLAGAFHTYTYSLFLKKWNAKTIYSHKHSLNDIEKNCNIEEKGLSYTEFYKYVENLYKNQELPSYLQIEHI